MRFAVVVCLAGVLAQVPSGRAGGGIQPEATEEPVPVLSAERAWAGADVLVPLAESGDVTQARYAIRALGRLEDPTLIPRLIAWTDSPTTAIRLAAASAIAQTLRHVDPRQDPDLPASASAAIRRTIGRLPVADSGPALAAIGDIAYANPADVAAVEDVLDTALDRTTAGEQNAPPRRAALHGFEALTRRNARMPGIGYKAETAARLVDIVRNVHPNDDDRMVRQDALRALVSMGTVSADALAAALSDDDDQVRRLAVQALGGGAVDVDADRRFVELHQALSDPSILVRIEAARSYAKKSAVTHGCGPLLESLRDDSLHVVLAALDALGTACPKDDDVTTRLTVEARPAPTVGAWQREAHAFVALARRDRERAQIATQAFGAHPVWQVRMYAARAAAAMEDVARLERLADDPNGNVRAAALPPLRKLKGDAADDAVLAALKPIDYQLARTAATLLKDSLPTPRFAKPIVEALVRLSRDQKETSRDARLPLLDALEKHGDAERASDLAPLLKDIDPIVAARAASVITKWTGTPTAPDAHPLVHAAAREWNDLAQCVALEMKSGPAIRLRMHPDDAPIAVGHVLKLALDDKYYDGLTFHRVEPNFVIQGGSPGANEYSSDQKYFMRDEIAASNVRGAVGLSTRGRNTGDGQFYIMLVDEPRLDGEYTIFANVFDSDLPAVDRIEEGDTIQAIRPTSCRAR